MPVLTRSQSALVSSVQKNPQKERKNQEAESPEELNTRNTSLEDWFHLMVHKYTNEIEVLNEKKTYMKKHNMSNILYYECYYNQLRLVSELFYIVENYLPSIYKKNDYYKDLLVVIYNAIQKLYSQIYRYSGLGSPVSNKNNKDEYLIKVTLEQLETTEKLIIYYLEKDQKKRAVRVDYTGMDSIEPESDYDITDMCENTTIYTDSVSDYEPSEVDEQSKGETYSDKELEDNWTQLVANKYEQLVLKQKTHKQNTHIRFTDDF